MELSTPVCFLYDLCPRCPLPTVYCVIVLLKLHFFLGSGPCVESIQQNTDGLEGLWEKESFRTWSGLINFSLGQLLAC